MELSDFLALCELAKKKEKEEKILQQWLSLFPYMNLKMLKYMSFDKYLAQCTGSNIDLRPADEIIAEIEEAHSKIQRREE